MASTATSSEPSSTSGAGDSANTGSSSSNSTLPTPSISNGISFMMRDKIALGLFLTRKFTIFFTLLFIFPFFGYDAPTLYQKALMGSATTSALKLHQRMAGVPFQLNRVYFGNLIVEDSFHYLLYALIFLNSFPITIVLMPVSAFALLHVSAYTINLLDAAGGPQSYGFIRKLANIVRSKDKDIMRFVAVTEILLGPTIVVMIFFGKAGIFVPFIYYRFICMRYQSRRNPYSKQMFYEFRLTLEHYSAQPSCPQILKSLIQRLVGVVCRMAPQPNQI